MAQGLPTIPMKEATPRERRILERLHEPFDNEERLAILREELRGYFYEVGEALADAANAVLFWVPVHEADKDAQSVVAHLRKVLKDFYALEEAVER